MIDILQYEESLVALDIANSSDCRILKKIPHFACFSCNKVLQSEESDLNMKTMLSFLRLLVMREIPCFVGFHKNKILQSEELNRKSPVPQIAGLIEIPHFVGYSWIKTYKMRNHHLT